MLIMIVPKPPKYDKQDLRSMIDVLIKEMEFVEGLKHEIKEIKLFEDTEHGASNENSSEDVSEEELRAIFEKLRAKFLEVIVESVFSYLRQFPFDDLFTDEKACLNT